jgi:hypothetical protein
MNMHLFSMDLVLQKRRGDPAKLLPPPAQPMTTSGYAQPYPSVF